MSADQLDIDVDTVEAAVWTVLGGEHTNDAALTAGLDPFTLAEAATTYRQAGRAALQQAATDSWKHLYIEFTDWARAEDTFTEHILPTLLRLRNTAQVRSWWFLRKHPCWRLRLLTPPGTVLPVELTDALNDAARRGCLNGWRPGIYEAETAAFGGAEAMNAVHELFAADSIATLTIRPTIKDVGERELSILLTSAMARAAGLEWYEQGDLWDRVAAERPLPRAVPHAMQAQMSKSLLPLVRADTSPSSALFTPGSPLHPAASWIAAFRTAGRQLGTASRSGIVQRGLREVLSYVVIFHWNRLGLTAGTQAALAAAARNAFFDLYSDTASTRRSVADFFHL